MAEPIAPIRKELNPAKMIFVGVLMLNILTLVVRTCLPSDLHQGSTDDELPRDLFQFLAASYGPDYDPRILGWVQVVAYLLTGLLLLAIVGSCARGGKSSCLSIAQNDFPEGGLSGFGRMMGYGRK